MRTLLVLVLLASSAHADYRVVNTSGAFREQPNRCRDGFRDMVLALVAPGVLRLAPDAMAVGRAAPDDLIVTDAGTWGVWRSGNQTVLVALRPKRGTPLRDVQISIIYRVDGSTCHETWRGLAEPRH